MTQPTRNNILNCAKRIFALSGYDGLSMRTLADQSTIGISSIYHFFADKDVLLKELFDITNSNLGIERAKLPNRKSAATMLKDRIEFQFTHIEDVVFVLKYFLHYRANFAHLRPGFVPPKAYLHIEEVLLYGIQTGEFKLNPGDVAREAKVITHAINGYLLEYYPDPPTGKELKEVVGALHRFIVKALSVEESL
jgi:AcrR family transcriptional regulator